MGTTHDSPFTAFAHQLADAAGAIIRPYFGAHGDVEAKGDNSPVTKADREAEAAMRALIVAQFPDHSIFGEEFGQELAAPVTRHPSPVTPSIKNYTWVIDPIDGTRAFIAGRREWGTLIALCENGVPVLGILDQPITGERWVGVRGAGTTHTVTPSNDGAHLSLTNINGPRHKAGVTNQCKTRPCLALAAAEISTTSALYFTPPQAGAFVKLAQSCRATVKDGDCYAYGLLARGLRDMVADAGLKPYDVLALVPIIEGAGGKITGWDGAPVTLNHFANVLAAGDAARHADALALLLV